MVFIKGLLRTERFEIQTDLGTSSAIQSMFDATRLVWNECLLLSDKRKDNVSLLEFLSYLETYILKNNPQLSEIPEEVIMDSVAYFYQIYKEYIGNKQARKPTYFRHRSGKQFCGFAKDFLIDTRKGIVTIPVAPFKLEVNFKASLDLPPIQKIVIVREYVNQPYLTVFPE